MNQAEHIISRFGGTTATARATGNPVTTVQGWKKRGRIPAKQQPIVLHAGQALDPPLSPADFFDGAGKGVPPS